MVWWGRPGIVGDRTLSFGFPLLFGAPNQFICVEAKFIRCRNCRATALGPVFDYIPLCYFLKFGAKKCKGSGAPGRSKGRASRKGDSACHRHYSCDCLERVAGPCCLILQSTLADVHGAIFGASTRLGLYRCIPS